MARKNISKIDKDIQAAEKKVEELRAERREAEENFYKEIGKLFAKKEFLKDESLSFEDLISRLKKEVKDTQLELKSQSKPTENAPQNSTEFKQ